MAEELGILEANEKVAGSTATATYPVTGGVVSGTITIPSNIAMGYTLMRVVCAESIAQPSATGTYAWGETEDYIVNLQGSPATISWQAGTSVVGTTNPLTLTPTGSTNYIATATDANGCSFIGGASVTMLPAPSAPTATNSIQCGTQVPTASVVSTAGAAGSGTMNWFAAATGGNALQSATSTTYTTSIASTTTFYVAEVGTNGCSSLRTPVTATVNVPDVLTASASNTIDVCANTPITLSTTKTGSSNTYAYTWNATPATGSGIAATGTAGATNGSLVVTPTTAGTYVYTITGFDGGVTPNCSITSSVTVNVVDPWNGFAASTSPTTASICDGGSVNINSIINGPQTAPTGYLNSNATSTADEEILNVSLGTNGSLLNNTSSCTTTGGAAGNGLQASILNQYSNYTTVSSVPVPTITTGQVVPYALTLGYCSGTAYSNMAKVYIDYNRNGTFEAAEQVAVTNYGARAVTGDVVSGTFTVPTNAAPGKTLMRVVYVESSVVNPTGTYTWGETEDYFVNITTAPATLAWSEGATVLGTTPSLSYTSTVVGPHTINFAATSAVGGCILNSSNTVVTVNAIPSAPSIATSVQCGTKVPTNTATSTAGSLGSGTFNWYTTATGGTPIETTTSGNLVNYQVATTTTLYVSEMSVAGCESARSPFLVTVNPIDPIFASASATANVCVNTPVALNVTKTGNQNTYVYNWTATPQANSGIATGGVSSNLNIPIVAIPSAAGTYAYKVTGTEASTGCAVTSTVNVSVIDPWNGFTATISPATTTVCSGIPAPLNAYIIGNQTLPSGYPTNSIATFVNYGEIFNVSLGANGSLLNNTSTCATTAGAAGNGLPASINQRYSNYTTVPTLQAPILAAGTTVPWSLNLGSCSFTTIFGYTIYIDFNRNGSFNDINEQVVVSGTTAIYPLTGTVVSGTFTVPANIPTGKTLMRVIMAYNNGNQAADASYFYGETEDYAVNLVGASSNTIDWKEGTTALGMGSSISYLGSVGSHIINYTATQANGCVINSQQATVNVLQLPTAPTATNSAHCGTKLPTASVTKTSGANGTGTFNWYTTPTGTTTAQVGTSTTFTSMISATTTFYVSEVGVNGCESARTPVTITVTPVDAITASASNTTNLCINTPVDLSVTQTGTNNTYLYTWTATPQAGSGIAATGISGATPSVTPTTAGVITYTVVGNQNGPAIYSNLAAGSTFDEDCGNVTITQGATTILNNTTTINSLVGTIGTAAGTASLRSDFTAFGPYTLNANGTYNLSITTLNQGTNYNHGIKAYIDYNRNGSFADAGETIYTSPALLAPPRTETASFTVPATALNGLTRLRVIVNEGNTLTPESAPTWGEVEEYTINLVTPNVGGGNPTTGCTTYSSINVNVINPWVGITASVTPATANICGLGTPVSLTGTSGGPATLPTGYLNSNATSTADEEILNVSLGTAGSLLNNSNLW